MDDINVCSWAAKEHLKLWKSPTGRRQVKMFIHGPDISLTRFALSLKRHDLCILVGLLTGHRMLNRYLTVMKTRTDPLCPMCMEEEETSIRKSLKSTSDIPGTVLSATISYWIHHANKCMQTDTQTALTGLPMPPSRGMGKKWKWKVIAMMY